MAENSESIKIYKCGNCDSVFHTKKELISDDLNCSSCGNIIHLRLIQSEGEICASARYECFSCGHTDKVTCKKSDYDEVMPCPKCEGFFVDIWASGKYKRTVEKSKSIGKLKVDIDVSDALKGLKAVERQAKKTTRALREVEEINNKE